MNPPPAIELLDVSFTYPDGRPALRGVSCRFAAGRCTAVIGPNGSGKSTLLGLLNGIHLAGRGAVRIDGLAVGQHTLAEVRRRVGLVFQEPDWQLFCPTVGEDVAFGLLNLGLSRDEILARVRETLDGIDLPGFENRSPFHLSGGEKKLASLATVLAMRPAVLALDEPTSGLDPFHRRRLIELVHREEVTRVVATHDLDLALELADDAVLLYEGRLVAAGPAAGILHDRELLEHHRLELPLRLQGAPAPGSPR